MFYVFFQFLMFLKHLYVCRIVLVNNAKIINLQSTTVTL